MVCHNDDLLAARRRLPRPPAPRPRDRHLGARRASLLHTDSTGHTRRSRARHGAGDERRARASGTPRSPTPRGPDPLRAGLADARRARRQPRGATSGGRPRRVRAGARSPGRAASPIGTTGASLQVARLAPGETVATPRRAAACTSSSPAARCGLARRAAADGDASGRRRPGGRRRCRAHRRARCGASTATRRDTELLVVDLRTDRQRDRRDDRQRARQHLDHGGRVGEARAATPSGSPSPPTGTGRRERRRGSSTRAPGEHGDLGQVDVRAVVDLRQRAHQRAAWTAASITTTSSSPSSTAAAGAICMPLP